MKLKWFHIAIFLYMLEFGVSIFNGDRVAAENIGTNYWLGILLIGLFVCLNLAFIALVARKAKGRSVFDIMEASFPKPFLIPIYIGLILFWIFTASVIGKDYTLLFQFLSFPSRDPMQLLLLYMVVMYFIIIQSIYGISRVLTCFFGIVAWLPLLLLHFIPEWDIHRLTPFFFKESVENLTIYSWVESYHLFVGYDMILILIPFCDDRELRKGLFIGQTFISLTYLMSNLAISGYISFKLLQKLSYPVLNLLSYIEFPFINRIESLTFILFVFISLSKSSIYCFGAILVLRRLFPTTNVKYLALATISIFYGFAFVMQVLRQTENVYRIFSGMELALAIFSPILLFLLIVHQRTSRKGRA